MAFESLSDKLQMTFARLKGKGLVTEQDIDQVMREVKLALLEADVHYQVVKDFTAAVKEKCLGQEVLKSLTPAQQVVKIVNSELVDLMGGAASKLTYAPSGFTIYMLVGLQGTGKTTTAAKLAAYLKQKGKNPLLAACDVYRPAAIDQLEIVGKQVKTPVYTDRASLDPVAIALAARESAEKRGFNVLVIDTAGRLQIDEALMEELSQIKKAVRPHEILLVVDALTGQDAVNVAEGFDGKLGVDGIIMTKMDGDSRGGAALSVKKVTGKPIKFLGTGEKLDALQPFHPDRMASRILGMGDVLSLIERAEQTYDEEEAAKLEQRLRKNQFTLEDFLSQMRQIKRMGGLAKVMKMMPGAGGSRLGEEDIAKGEQEFTRFEAIIYSMTPEERRDPSLLNASRRKRIAEGCGHSVTHVNTLIKKYTETRKVMRKFSDGKALKRGGLFRGLR